MICGGDLALGEATDSMREKIKTHDWADLALGEATDSLRKK